MTDVHQRLQEELSQSSDLFRSLVPVERARLIDQVVDRHLTAHYAELLEAARQDLESRRPPPSGKDDSWSW